MITKKQLYYITNCYPEKITDEEAEDVYKKAEPDDSYWELAARIVNELANEPNKVLFDTHGNLLGT